MIRCTYKSNRSPIRCLEEFFALSTHMPLSMVFYSIVLVSACNTASREKSWYFILRFVCCSLLVSKESLLEFKWRRPFQRQTELRKVLYCWLFSLKSDLGSLSCLLLVVVKEVVLRFARHHHRKTPHSLLYSLILVSLKIESIERFHNLIWSCLVRYDRVPRF